MDPGRMGALAPREAMLADRPALVDADRRGPGPPLLQAGVSRQATVMTDAPYLVALALLEQNGQRALPLNGRSLSPAAAVAPDPGEVGRSLALELLLRLWQRSEEGALRRAAGEASLLLVELPLELLQEQLPALKARWIGGGATAEFHAALAALAIRGWRVSIARYEPVHFTPWP
jgi:hypothetical protein